MALPPCGVYRTREPLGDVAAGRFVYFHNHGEPGPGIYLPAGWEQNRARWHQHGTTVTDPAWASTLEPLAAEGLYRVRESFTCCQKNCRTFEPELLVQLGYDGEAHAILFVPEWSARGLGFPERGTRIDANRIAKMTPLRVPEAPAQPAPAGGMLH